MALAAVAFGAIRPMGEAGSLDTGPAEPPLQTPDVLGPGLVYWPSALFPDLIVDGNKMVEAYIFEPPPEPQLSLVEIATVRTAAYGGQLTEAEMVAVLREAGWEEWAIPEALGISWCESRWSPFASGDGGVSLGLFQMGIARPGWDGWFRYFGVDESLAYDAVTNARVARWAWERSGWSPWSCAR